MGLRHALKKGFSWGFSPKRWIGLNYVKSNTKICSDLAKDIINSTVQKSKHIDSTSQNQSTKSRMTIGLTLIFTYLCLSLVFVGYAWYMFFIKDFIFSGFVTLAISGLVITYFIRELLIYAQLKFKRNKLTLKELFKHAIKGFRR